MKALARRQPTRRRVGKTAHLLSFPCNAITSFPDLITTLQYTEARDVESTVSSSIRRSNFHGFRFRNILEYSSSDGRRGHNEVTPKYHRWVRERRSGCRTSTVRFHSAVFRFSRNATKLLEWYRIEIEKKPCHCLKLCSIEKDNQKHKGSKVDESPSRHVCECWMLERQTGGDLERLDIYVLDTVMQCQISARSDLLSSWTYSLVLYLTTPRYSDKIRFGSDFFFWIDLSDRNSCPNWLGLFFLYNRT